MIDVSGLRADCEKIAESTVYTCKREYPYEMLTASAGCRELTGYSQDELTNNKPTYGSLILPDWRGYVESELSAAVKDGRVYTLVYQITTTVGDKKWVYERGKGYYKDRNLDHLEGFVIDFNVQKGEEELRIRKRTEHLEYANRNLLQNISLRKHLAYTFVWQFAIANAVILGLVGYNGFFSPEGIRETTLLSFFGATVAELAGVVILIAKYLFPFTNHNRSVSPDSPKPHNGRKPKELTSRDGSLPLIQEDSSKEKKTTGKV